MLKDPLNFSNSFIKSYNMILSKLNFRLLYMRNYIPIHLVYISKCHLLYYNSSSTLNLSHTSKAQNFFITKFESQITILSSIKIFYTYLASFVLNLMKMMNVVGENKERDVLLDILTFNKKCLNNING